MNMKIYIAPSSFCDSDAYSAITTEAHCCITGTKWPCLWLLCV